MKNSLRAKILTVFVFSNLILISVSIVYSFMVLKAEKEGREVIECFFKHTLFLYCPGCGGSRSLLYLLKFDIIKSFLYYPALPVAALIILDLDIRAAIAFIKNDVNPIKKFKANILLVIPILIFINFFVRNILLLGFGIDYLGDFLKEL